MRSSRWLAAKPPSCVCTLPAYASLGERFSVEAIASDSWGSLAANYQGHDLEFDDPSLGTGQSQYDPALLHYVAANVVANQEGVFRLEVRSQDGATARHEQSDSSGEVPEAASVLRRPPPAHLPARRSGERTRSSTCMPDVTGCSISALSPRTTCGLAWSARRTTSKSSAILATTGPTSSERTGG